MIGHPAWAALALAVALAVAGGAADARARARLGFTAEVMSRKVRDRRLVEDFQAELFEREAVARAVRELKDSPSDDTPVAVAISRKLFPHDADLAATVEARDGGRVAVARVTLHGDGFLGRGPVTEVRVVEATLAGVGSATRVVSIRRP